MIRVAFTLIGGKNWTGGRNYLLNLLQALTAHQGHVITPVLFVPTDDDAGMEAFAMLPGVEVVRSRLFDVERRKTQLLVALLWGHVPALSTLFAEHRIDAVFEAAQFFGWRLKPPTIAWIPDFQHKALPHLFPIAAWWKREFGFRAQIIGGRAIMLSSDDAKRACERHYPATLGRTRTVHFAVLGPAIPDYAAARAVVESYGLPSNFIFMPNQFWRHKNHMVVLEALSILRSRGSTVVVAASGKQHDPRAPAYFPTFDRMLKERGLDSSLRLLGLIPYEHLGALMRCCQAMLNPSLFEGWSTTVEEARTMGTPMLLSDIDVHREQMGAAAKYFRRDSAEDLADLLEQTPLFDGSARETALKVAQSEAEVRVHQFAKDFACLSQEVVGAGRV